MKKIGILLHAQSENNMQKPKNDVQIDKKQSPKPENHMQIEQSPKPENHIQIDKKQSSNTDMQIEQSPKPENDIQIDKKQSPNTDMQIEQSPKPEKYFTVISKFKYNDDVDTTREMAIIGIHTNVEWQTTNIAYYKTSATSNFNMEKYRDTWLPCGGLLNMKENYDNIKVQKLKGIIDNSLNGFIIKMSNFADTYYTNSVYDIIYDYYKGPLKNHINKYFIHINDTDIDDPDIDCKKYLNYRNSICYSLSMVYNKDVYEIFKDIEEIMLFLETYFTDYWQLFISCSLKEGYWKHNTSFTTFIENHHKEKKMDLTNFTNNGLVEYNTEKTLKLLIDLFDENGKNILFYYFFKIRGWETRF